MYSVALAVLPCVGMIGCAGTPAQMQTPMPANAIRLPEDAQASDRGLLAAGEVLKDHGYVLDRIDHRFGVVTTRPIDSPTIVEPWWVDNQSADLAWRSTLNAYRRIVRVSVEDGSLSVEVLLEQYQQPGSRVISRFGNPVQTLRELPEEWSQRRLSPGYWQPMGRDTLLEERLLREIAGRLSLS